ncbi:MAG: CDP-archaeol synthase [Pirellulales bacterium]
MLVVAALAAVCWLDSVVTRPGAFLLPIAVMLSWMCVVELLDMFNKRGRQPLAWALYCGVLLSVMAAGMQVFWPESVAGNTLAGLGWLAIGLVVALLLALIGELQRYDGRWHITINLGLSAFTILYVGGLMGFVMQLRLLNGRTASEGGRLGMLALVSLIATVKMSDIGQYTVGRLFGKHKLAPLISPGKTWEGAAGGVLFAVATAWIVFHWGATALLGSDAVVSNQVAVVLFGVLVAIAGMIGDLAESMIKRDAEVKDSSNWLPGFGGVLDMLDSLLGAAPVAYVFWVMGIVGL